MEGASPDLNNQTSPGVLVLVYPHLAAMTHSEQVRTSVTQFKQTYKLCRNVWAGDCGACVLLLVLVRPGLPPSRSDFTSRITAAYTASPWWLLVAQPLEAETKEKEQRQRSKDFQERDTLQDWRLTGLGSDIIPFASAPSCPGYLREQCPSVLKYS